MKSRQYFVSLELQRTVNVECYHFANKSTPLNITSHIHNIAYNTIPHHGPSTTQANET